MELITLFCLRLGGPRGRGGGERERERERNDKTTAIESNKQSVEGKESLTVTSPRAALGGSSYDATCGFPRWGRVRLRIWAAACRHRVVRPCFLFPWFFFLLLLSLVGQDDGWLLGISWFLLGKTDMQGVTDRSTSSCAAAADGNPRLRGIEAIRSLPIFLPFFSFPPTWNCYIYLFACRSPAFLPLACSPAASCVCTATLSQSPVSFYLFSWLLGSPRHPSSLRLRLC